MSEQAIKPLKVCMIGNARSIHFKRWVELFTERGHQVHVLTIHELTDIPVPVDSIEPKYPLPYLRTFQRILNTRKLVKRYCPDLVLGQYLVGFGWYAAYSGGPIKTVISWGSDISPLVQRSRFNEWMNRRALSRLDFVIALSDFMKDSFLRYGVEEEKILRINFPPSPLPGPDEGESFGDVFAPLGLQPGKYLVSIRGMDKVYNQETILKAIPEVLKTHPDLRFVFIRYGANPDYPVRIEQMIREMGLGDAARVIESQPLDRFALLCRNALGAISVSLSDVGVPISILEVMSIGTPIIAGRIPPLEKTIRNQMNVFMVDKFSSEQIAEAVRELDKHPQWRKLFAEANEKILLEYRSPLYGLKRLEERVEALNPNS